MRGCYYTHLFTGRVDKSLFSEYISASVYQARYLLIDVETVTKFPNHRFINIEINSRLSLLKTEHAAERPPLLPKTTYGDLRKQIPQLNTETAMG